MLQDNDPSADTLLKSAHKLPRRDYLLLPLLSVLTIAAMFTVCEAATRTIWSEQEDDVCFVNDPIAGFHFKPNCTARVKNAEGPWTTNSYNDCGFRSPTSCGPKPADSFRIAILGSSVSQGVFVPYEETFPARAAAELERVCHFKIDVQNLGVPNSSPIYVYRRLEKALALRPDLVIFVITPFDLEQQIDPQQLAERNNRTIHDDAPAATLTLSPYKRLQKLLTGSRSTFVAQHFLLQNEQTFIKLYLLYGDKADFLRQPLTEAWQKRFNDLDVIVGDMSKRARSAGARLLIVPVPSRAESAILSTRHPIAGVDAAAFGRRVEQIAAKDGADSVDLMTRFRQIPRSEDLFYAVDGHLTGDGQAVIAQGLVQKLLGGSFAIFEHCAGDKRKS